MNTCKNKNTMQMGDVQSTNQATFIASVVKYSTKIKLSCDFILTKR